MPAGSLGFSVMLFTISALIALSLLMLRRNVASLGSAELGGPVTMKYISGTVLVLLWVFYITLSCLQDYHIIDVHF